MECLRTIEQFVTMFVLFFVAFVASVGLADRSGKIAAGVAADSAEGRQCIEAAEEELVGSSVEEPVLDNRCTAVVEALGRSLWVGVGDHWAVVAVGKEAAARTEGHRGGRCWPRPGMS